MNPKRILSLSLMALAASCVESADKPVLRGQATTKTIQRQRQLKKESGPVAVETCGGVGEDCCQFKHQGTDYLYCTFVEHSCISGMCTVMATTTSATAGIAEGDAPMPVCVASGENVCDVVASGNGISCSDDNDCLDDGTTCYFDGCVRTCTNNNPSNDEFTCNDGDACHPSDSTCCVEPTQTGTDEKTGEEIEVAGLMYCL